MKTYYTCKRCQNEADVVYDGLCCYCQDHLQKISDSQDVWRKTLVRVSRAELERYAERITVKYELVLAGMWVLILLLVLLFIAYLGR